MTDSQDKYRRFFAMMEAFDQAIPGARPLSTAGLRLYWEELQNYDIDRLEEAGRICLRICKFRPSICEIMENIPLPVYKDVLRIEESPEERSKGDIRAHWRSKWMIWMLGAEKVGTKPNGRGLYKYLGGKRWKNCVSDVPRAKKYWVEFVNTVKVDGKPAPVWLIEEVGG